MSEDMMEEDEFETIVDNDPGALERYSEFLFNRRGSISNAKTPEELMAIFKETARDSFVAFRIFNNLHYEEFEAGDPNPIAGHWKNATERHGKKIQQKDIDAATALLAKSKWDMKDAIHISFSDE